MIKMVACFLKFVLKVCLIAIFLMDKHCSTQSDVSVRSSTTLTSSTYIYFMEDSKNTLCCPKERYVVVYLHTNVEPLTYASFFGNCSTYYSIECVSYPQEYCVTFPVVGRTAYKYQCSKLQNTPDILYYYILYYFKAANQQCGSVNVDAGNITLKCSTTKVYPVPVCEYSIQLTNDGRADLSSFIAYDTKNLTNSNQTYYSVNCTLNLPVTNFNTGVYQISFSMYVKSFDGSKINVSQENTVNSITIDLPTGYLAAGCSSGLNIREGYINSETAFECMCIMNYTGNPPGYAQWFQDNTPLSRSHDGIAKLIVNFEPLDPRNTTYTCRAVSIILNRTSDIGKLTTRFAYGPFNVTVDGPRLLNVCGDPTFLNFTCQVKKEDVQPISQFTFFINDAKMETIWQSNITEVNSYKSILAYSPTKSDAGSLRVKCNAKNSLFDFFQEAQIAVEIQEPPSMSPILMTGEKNYTGNISSVLSAKHEGEDFEIICQIVGGYPSVQHISLQCGENFTSFITNSNTLKLTIKKINRQLNKKQCFCKAEHISGCYSNNVSSVTLNITYPARIVYFKANANSSLIVSNGSDVTFVCEVDSNPAASVSVFRKINYNIITNKEVTQVFCDDSGEYICKVNNTESIDQDSSSIIVYVQCPLQLKNLADNEKVFAVKLGNNAVIEIEVYGFPSPIAFSLFGKSTVNVTELISYNVSGSGKTDRWKFDYKPSSEEIPYGTVKLIIYNLVAADYTNYTVNIKNGYGNGLQYDFEVIEEIMTIESVDDEIIGAAIGGGIGLAVVLFIFSLYIGKHYLNINQSKIAKQKEIAVHEWKNDDIYFENSKGNLFKRGIYKNYSDLDVTITTATALPLNLKVKPNPALQPDYFNTISGHSDTYFTQVSDKQNLIRKETDTSGCFTNIFEENPKDNDVYANMKD